MESLLESSLQPSPHQEGIYVLISRIATGYYFLFFLVILPILSRYENTRTIPTSIAASVLSDKFGNEKTSTENI